MSQGWELIKLNKYHRSLAALAELGMERAGWVVGVWGILWLGWSPWLLILQNWALLPRRAGGNGESTGTASTPVGTAAPGPAQPTVPWPHGGQGAG